MHQGSSFRVKGMLKKFFLLSSFLAALAAALPGCATDGLTGRPKAYFLDTLGPPAGQGTDDQGVEWLQWEGIAKYEQNFSYEPHVWKFIVRFRDGVSVAYSKPQGFHPPPAFMRKDAHGVQHFGSQRFP